MGGRTAMRVAFAAAAAFLLAACGAESVGAAAGVAKLQAEQARQGKESLDSVKAGVDAAAQASQDKLKRAEEGGS